MSISNLSSSTVRQDQSLYRKLLREDNVDAARMGQNPMTQITITVGASGFQSASSQQIEVGSAGRSSMIAIMNSMGLDKATPPPPPGGTEKFTSGMSSLFEALESGDDEAATAAADTLQTFLDEMDAVRSSSKSKTTDTTEADDTKTEPEVITSLRSILEAVSDGKFDTAKAEARSLAESVTQPAPPGPPPSRGAPPTGRGEEPPSGGVMPTVSDLLVAVREGDTETVETIAASLRESLTDLDETTTTATGESFDTDLAALLNAIEAGDTEAATSAAKTIEGALARAASPTTASDDDLATNIEAALTSLEDLATTSSTSSTDTPAFVDTLKDLLEALKSGSDVDQKLATVLAAYNADDTATA